MTLTLHNTLTRKREPLEPVRPGHVGMYVCGPTVYDLAHIGNARPIVVFDVLYRVLKRLYPSVTYVRNITDVDDKINEASRRSGEPIESITARTTTAFHEDIAALGALPPDVEPRATGAHTADDRAHRDADRSRQRLRGGGSRALPRALGTPLRRAFRPQPRRDDRGRARRGRALQARPCRLRAVEAERRDPAGLGKPLGPRAARLAHRVLGHEPRLSGRDPRHPRRRSWT